MKIVIGLGNPGREYAATRHNAGFMALDALRELLQFPDFKTDKKLHGEVSKGKINGQPIILLKPDTFMNDSGISAAAALNFFKIAPADLIVIHDDKDIPLGETRLQTDRGSAGHNGVKSIIEQLGTKNFSRLRIGISPSEKIASTKDFVLDRFSPEENQTLQTTLEGAALEIKNLL